MGLALEDPDNDGDDDIVVTNITRETHAFYRNLGRGQFEDARVAGGLSGATAPYTGFGTDWIDYNNDGWLDLFVANGAVTTIEALRADPFPFRQPNQLLRNDLGEHVPRCDLPGRPRSRAVGREPWRGVWRCRQRRRCRCARHH